MNDNPIIRYFFSGESINEFKEKLRENDYTGGMERLLRDSFIEGIILLFLFLAVSTITEIDFLYIIGFSLAGLLSPFLFNYFFQLYRFEQRKREKERLIPDVLLQASVFPEGTDSIQIIKYLAKENYGNLSREFNKAYSEIRKGASIERALNNLKKRCRSRVIARAMDLLIQGHNSGAEMNSVFRETAEDILETQSIIRDRNSTMVIEKYTLILAGGFIVPLVLGLIVGMITGMNFSGINELGMGMSLEQRKELLSAALLSNQVYIAEYSIIASVFIANQEGNIKKAFLYALILLPLSLLTYNLAKGL